MIKVENIEKRFDNIVALDNVSFEVEKGETFGLLGPNGAGKTTTINILCGLARPDHGTVSLDGRTDPTQPSVRLSIGVAPQSLAIYEELSALDNLRFFGRIYGLKGSKLKKQVDKCLEIAGLKDRCRDQVAKYSGGMKRRLNFVCSLLHEPPVLLLDEPTVGVDPQTRNLIFQRIEQMKSEGRTIVYTTHYMEEAQRLCNRVAILDKGQILDIDTVDNLISKHGGPTHIVAEFEEKPDSPDEIIGQIKGMNVTLQENLIRFQTTQPMESLASLNKCGQRFRSLKVNRANLEDVFLNITGRRLRDE
jgi:ABC-2 type transport system ATP-binding protein